MVFDLIIYFLLNVRNFLVPNIRSFLMGLFNSPLLCCNFIIFDFLLLKFTLALRYLSSFVVLITVLSIYFHPL